jgi:hypothetical protein
LAVTVLRSVGTAFAPRVLDHRPTAARPHVVMEHLNGCTVDALVYGPLTETDTNRLAVQLATLLDAVQTAVRT